MGLDMYLEARTSSRIDYSNYDESKKSAFEAKREVFPFASEATDCHPIEQVGIVAYWRKANAIHRWFVENVQDGVDNCQSFYVSVEQLRALLDAVDLILATVDRGQPVTQTGMFGPYESHPDVTFDTRLAQDLLPSQEGFFFGSTDYDRWYVLDLQTTHDQLSAIVNHPDVDNFYFYYQSSW